LLPRRAAASVAGSGGALGLYLSAVGVYGLIAFVFAQRSREFAVRMALGATPAQVKSLVVRQTLPLAVAGGVAGFALAAVLGSIIRARKLFVDLPAVEPLTGGTAGLVVAAVLLASTLLAARRAGCIDTVRSLRGE